MKLDYPTLFFFEVDEWWDYTMPVLVTVGLAVTAWLAIRSKWVALAVFIVIPARLTIFWRSHSIAGISSAGWSPIVRQYSVLIGFLSLVALQYFPKSRTKYWYLCTPPLTLSVNILEAVIRGFQHYGLHGVDPSNNPITVGGPWNTMNGIADILNLLVISGWAGIYVSARRNRQIIWGGLTVGWVIAYDVWNVAYVYNCLTDRAWYSGVALLLSCTIPAFLSFGKGAWIQYRAYTLIFWSAVVLTFLHSMHDFMFAYRSAHNPTALLIISAMALAINLVVLVIHIHRIISTKRDPLRQEVYADTRENPAIARNNTSEFDRQRINKSLRKELLWT